MLKRIVCSISSPSYFTPKSGEETVYKPIELIGLRSQNDIELHVKEVKKQPLQ